MSLIERVECLRKKVKPGSEWRRRKYIDRTATVLEVAVCAKETEPKILFRYGPSYNFVWISEPSEFFKHYERVENE